MRSYDSYQGFKKKQIRIKPLISASYTRQSSKETVYYIWGGGSLTISSYPPSTGVLPGNE